MELDLSVYMLDRMERTSSKCRELSSGSGDNAGTEVNEDHPCLQLELKLPCPKDQEPAKNCETRSSVGFETTKNTHNCSMKRPLSAPNDCRSYEMHPSSITSACRIKSQRSYWRSSDDDGGSARASRKKLCLTKEQSFYLEECFKEHATLNPKQKISIAKKLNLRPRQVEVWFQNRRARTKLKQTEVDFEYLKRCCEALTNENRRLHREIQELKPLKFSFHQLRLHTSATTLKLCPSCERRAVVDTGGRKLT